MNKRINYILSCAFAALLVGVWIVVVQNDWQSHALEWLNLLVRWVHVIFGIGWIGASFYFIFLENSLNRTDGLRDGLAGNLWAIHGGGFYYIEKYKVAPQKLPEKLHWFKYEAYLTWISGMGLLAIVYYSNARLFLIDPEVRDLSPALAIAIGVGSMFLAWFVYDFLCKSPLLKQSGAFALTGFLLTTGMAFFFTQVFRGHAAFIHTGAVLGTLMAGNVFRVIIPSQKAMVAAVERGSALNPELGKHAGLRSLHNNYMTLPVVFIMISSHFPGTYSNAYNWAVLAGLFLASTAVRHYLNLHERGETAVWLLPVATALILTLAFVTAPVSRTLSVDRTKVVPFEKAQLVIYKHCVPCHSANPTDLAFRVAPKGVKFDTPEQIVNLSEKIMIMAVINKTMPLTMQTGITQADRDLLQVWIEQGAKRTAVGGE